MSRSLPPHPILPDFSSLSAVRMDSASEMDKPRSVRLWVCVCECGETTKKRTSELETGSARRCKKCSDAARAEKMTKHGHTRNGGSRTYRAWNNMLQRCSNPKNSRYNTYGARGIRVCEKWHNFEGFLEDMGEAPDDRSLDRIDNDAGYFKENCRWATREQQVNNRTTCRRVTIGEETRTITSWCKKIGIKQTTVRNRMSRGMDVVSALTTPVEERKRSHEKRNKTTN